jgi:hypothetical protein
MTEPLPHGLLLASNFVRFECKYCSVAEPIKIFESASFFLVMTEARGHFLPMKPLMTRTIERAIQGTEPKTAERMDALAGVRWVLASEDGRFVAVNERAEAEL